MPQATHIARLEAAKALAPSVNRLLANGVPLRRNRHRFANDRHQRVFDLRFAEIKQQPLVVIELFKPIPLRQFVPAMCFGSRSSFLVSSSIFEEQQER